MIGSGRLLPLIGLTAAALAQGACGGSTGPKMEAVLETEHFVYYQQAGLPAPCPSIASWLERYYNAFESFIGEPRPLTRKVAYRLYSDSAAALAACQGLAFNCYLPDSETIVAVEALKPHEIAHVFETLLGTPDRGPALFSEGLATLLGGSVGGARADGRLDTSLDLENLLGTDEFFARTREIGAYETYPPAAGLVRFLLDRYGKGAFLAFYGSLDDVSDGPKLEGRFRSTFGEEIRAVIGAWRAAVPPVYDEVLLNGPVCEQVPALPAGGSTVDPGCGYDAVRFEVPATGRIDLLVREMTGQPAGDPPLVQLYRCDGGIPLDNGLFVAGDLRISLDVAPGSYMALVAGAPASVEVVADAVTLDVDATCTAARIAAPLGGPTRSSLLVVRRWTNSETHLALDLDVASQGSLGITGVSTVLNSPNDVYVCPEECAPNPDQQCAHDNRVGVQSNGEPRTVYGMSVAAGDRLHFETGGRMWPDWQYSVLLSVEGTAGQ